MTHLKKLLLANVVALSGCLSLLNTQSDYPDAIFHSGKIYTMDEKKSWAEAVAVKDGRFTAVGFSSNILALAGPDTKQINLKGAMALPGMTDAHFHTLGVVFFIECTPGQFSPDKLREVLKYCKTKLIDGHPWLTINGMEMWHSSDIDNSLVNEAFPDMPVRIRDVSGHTALVNSKALELAGITKDTPQPEGGTILKHPETGEPTGVLAEPGAIGLVEQLMPPYPPAILEQGMSQLLQSLLAEGITSFQDALMDEVYLNMLIGMDERGTPMPYIFNHITWSPLPEERERSEKLIKKLDEFYSRHVTAKGIKVFIDGVPVPPAFTHVPLDEHGEIDETNLLVTQPLLAEKLIEWDKAGLKVKMHSSADGAVRVALNAIEAARKANGNSGIRHEVAHTSDVSEADQPRFAELNAAAEISPYFWHLGGIVGETGYQFHSLHENGALITIGSDFPVVPSFNPFPPLQGIVERQGQSVPLETALKFVTRNAAESINRLGEFGTIETDKIANMIVLDQNLFEVPSNKIGETKVLKTILDGNIVYEAR